MMAENHQGVVAVVPPFNYCEIEDILDLAKEKGEDPFILVLDGIEDPHNLGSIIRTAETAGVHGIIIPKRRNAAVNSTVTKVSAGATTYMKIARVNLYLQKTYQGDYQKPLKIKTNFLRMLMYMALMRLKI